MPRNTFEIDIYTIVLTPSRYVVEISDDPKFFSKTLPAYSFEDVRIVPRILAGDLSTGCVVVNRNTKGLMISSYAGGGLKYRREDDLLMIVCKPGQPEFMYELFSITAEDIERGFQIELSEETRSRDFEIYTQLLYDHIYDLYSCN